MATPDQGPWHLSSPQTHVSLTHAPLSATAVLDQIRSPRAGALVLFAGTTRDSFAGKPVRELHYSAYAPRALRTMAAVADKVRARHGLEGVAIVHRLGTVPVGEESVLIGVAAAHRGPAWRAGEEALELVKERVEVWKREEFFGEEGVWRANRDGAQGVYETGPRGTKEEESVSGQGQEQTSDAVAETPGREEIETAGGDSKVER
ncbi:Molybdopterin synthase catalytic subunit [Verticillium nonalfalfae]|uniref:Molybdopterin synthase catalytic subunit n=1 Tax=Verticillium nonalfalfae TaxID=1051616 RepID=A0A3M9XZM7_9PEZI|nr:Molybdopterin synthase catalytic subunit [Verticillium nonalfalfae]RNJ53471.1 Molybdopterin synthase catalytic subunit [Verticillium nonalfalfae]